MQRTILGMIFLLCVASINCEASNTKHTSKPSTVERELKCLTDNIFNEGSGESEQGQKGIGMITINRAKSKTKQFKHTICGAVYQEGQFSWVAVNPTIKDLTTYSKISVIAKELYNEYYIKGNVPKDLDILKTVMYFSRGVPAGFRHVTTIGGHKYSAPKPIVKKPKKGNKDKKPNKPNKDKQRA